MESQLREAILEGHFAQGEKLPAETELAQQFGVSRPTVREALGALVSSGLIRKIPGVAGGSFVNTVTPDSLSQMLSESMDTIVRIGALSIDEITEVRRVLEIPAAQWAARNRSQADIDEMKRVVEIQKTTTIDDPDIPSYDLRFHTTVGRASGNRLLEAFIAAVHDATHPAQFLDVTPEVAQEDRPAAHRDREGDRGRRSRPWPARPCASIWTSSCATPTGRVTSRDPRASWRDLARGFDLAGDDASGGP